jgi:hypothetical protein
MGFSQNRNDYSRTVKYMYSNPVGAQRTFTWFDQQRYLNWNLSTQLTNAMRFKASGGHQWNTSRRGTPSFQSEGSTFSGLTGTSAVLNGQSTSGGWTSATYYPTEQQFKDNYELTGSDYINHTFSGNLDWILSPTFFVNMTAGTLIYNTTQPPNFATQSARVTYGASNTSYLPGVIPDDLRHASGWANIDKSNSLTARSYYQRLFANLNTIWYASFAGQHTFKFGARFERVNNEMNDGYQFPVFNIYWNSSYTNPSGVTDRGTYGYYRHPHGERTGAQLFRGRGHQVRLPGQDGAPRRIRVGRQRQRAVEGLWQLRMVLRRHEAVAAHQLVRRRSVDRLLLRTGHVRLVPDRL